MALSSAHISAGSGGFFGHNSREAETVNSIFSDEKNYCSCTKSQAFKTFRTELEKRSEKYKLRTGQNLQKNVMTHLSIMLNFEKHHTVKDMQKVAKYFEKLLDTKTIQLAMHRDEGHIIDEETVELHKKLGVNIENTDIKNYHAHLEIMGLDSQGNSIRKKLDKPMLRQIQTDVANILKMERGRESSYNKEEWLQITAKLKPQEEYESKSAYNEAFRESAKELGLYKAPKAKRIETYEFKKIKEEEALLKKELLKTQVAELEGKEEIKVLKKENSSLKSQNTKLTNSKAVQKELLEALKLQNIELQSKLSSREEHAQREALNTKFKAEIKARDVTIEEIKVKFKELEEKLIPKLEKEISHLKSVIQVKDLDITDLNNQNKSLQAQKEVLASKVTALELKTAHSSNIAPSDVLIEFKKIQKEEIQEKTVKTAILKSEKIQVLENPDSFIKKAWNLISSKYNQLLEEVKALRFENKAMKIEIAQLKDKDQTIVPKQQKESSDIFEKIQREAKRNLEATFLVDKEKEITTTPKIRRDR